MSSETVSQTTFDDLVREGVRHELDAIVAGMPLADRVRASMERAALWSAQNTKVPNPTDDVAELREALSKLLNEHDRNTCIHEETYRGGGIWTICSSCGRKWADDRGGFKPHTDHPAVANARNILWR